MSSGDIPWTDAKKLKKKICKEYNIPHNNVIIHTKCLSALHESDNYTIITPIVDPIQSSAIQNEQCMSIYGSTFSDTFFAIKAYVHHYNYQDYFHCGHIDYDNHGHNWYQLLFNESWIDSEPGFRNFLWKSYRQYSLYNTNGIPIFCHSKTHSDVIHEHELIYPSFFIGPYQKITRLCEHEFIVGDLHYTPKKDHSIVNEFRTQFRNIRYLLNMDDERRTQLLNNERQNSINNRERLAALNGGLNQSSAKILTEQLTSNKKYKDTSTINQWQHLWKDYGLVHNKPVAPHTHSHHLYICTEDADTIRSAINEYGVGTNHIKFYNINNREELRALHRDHNPNDHIFIDNTIHMSDILMEYIKTFKKVTTDNEALHKKRKVKKSSLEVAIIKSMGYSLYDHYIDNTISNYITFHSIGNRGHILVTINNSAVTIKEKSSRSSKERLNSYCDHFENVTSYLYDKYDCIYMPLNNICNNQRLYYSMNNKKTVPCGFVIRDYNDNIINELEVNNFPDDTLMIDVTQDYLLKNYSSKWSISLMALHWMTTTIKAHYVFSPCMPYLKKIKKQWEIIMINNMTALFLKETLAGNMNGIVIPHLHSRELMFSTMDAIKRIVQRYKEDYFIKRSDIEKQNLFCDGMEYITTYENFSKPVLIEMNDSKDYYRTTIEEIMSFVR